MRTSSLFRKTINLFLSVLMIITLMPTVVAKITAEGDEQVVKIGDATYDSLEEALAVVKDNETIVLAQGDYMPNNVGSISNVSGKTFKIKGAGKELTSISIGDGTTKGSDGKCDYRFSGAKKVSFEDMTINETSGYDFANKQGFAHLQNSEFKNCIITGCTSYWGTQSCVIDTCEFVGDEYQYLINTWGCPSMTIVNPLFRTKGKAIKMYGAGKQVLKVENCTFISAEAKKPAILVTTKDYNDDYTLYINNSSNDKCGSLAIGDFLWGTDDINDVVIDENHKLVVYKDDIKVYDNGTTTSGKVETNVDKETGDEVSVKLENVSDLAKKVEAVIPDDTFKVKEETTKPVTIDDTVGTISFDSTATEKIAENAGENDVTLSILDTTKENGTVIEESNVENAKVLSIELKANENAVYSVENAAGNATITIPYKKINADSEICVYYLNGNTKENVPFTYENELLSITVKHFSEYLAGEKAPDTAQWKGFGYSTLAGAIRVAQADKTNNTVTLLSDTDEVVEINELTGSVIIDGNGKTLSGKLKLTGNKTNDITIKNLNVTNNGIDVDGFKRVTIGGVNDGEGNTFTNITGKNRLGVADAILVYNSNQALIYNNTIDGADEVGIDLANISIEAIVNGNVVKNTSHNSLQIVSFDGVSKPEAFVSNNTFENWGCSDKNSEGKNAGRALRAQLEKLDFNNNVMINDEAPEEFVKITDAGMNPLIDVSENYWNSGDPSRYISGTIIPYYIGISPNKKSEIVSYYSDATMKTLVEYPSHVAQIGDTKYETFEEAVEIARNNKATEIKLLSDITIDSAIVIGNDGISDSKHPAENGKDTSTSIIRIDGRKDTSITTIDNAAEDPSNAYYTIEIEGDGVVVWDYLYTSKKIHINANIIDETINGNGLFIRDNKDTYPTYFYGAVKLGNNETFNKPNFMGPVSADVLSYSANYNNNNITANSISAGTFSISDSNNYVELKEKVAEGYYLDYQETKAVVTSGTPKTRWIRNDVAYETSTSIKDVIKKVISGDVVTAISTTNFDNNINLPVGVTLIVNSGLDYPKTVNPASNSYILKKVLNDDGSTTYNNELLTADNAVACITKDSSTSYYATVTKAISAATANDTVKLLKDSTEAVTLPIGVILDTNGKSCGDVSAKDPGAYKILNEGGVLSCTPLEATDEHCAIVIDADGNIVGYFATLSSAAAKANEIKIVTDEETKYATVKLLKNRDERLAISQNYAIILDLNGFKITQGVSTATGTIDLSGHSKLILRDSSEEKTGTIEDNRTKAPESKSFGIYFSSSNGAELIVEGGTIIGKQYGIYLYQNNGVASLSNCTVKGGVHSIAAFIGTSTKRSNIKVNVTSGYYTGGTGKDVFNIPGTNTSLTIYGGNFSSNPTGKTNVTIADGYEVTSFSPAVYECGYKLSVKDGEEPAQILDTNKQFVAKYSTLKEAVAAVENGQTIQLLQNTILGDNIEITNKTITLDLNNHGISSSVNGLTPLLVNGNTNLKVKGNGSISSNGEHGILVKGNAILTIDSADISATSSNGSGVSLFDSSTLNFNSGSISGGKFGIADNGSGSPNCTININGGTVTGTGAGIYHPGGGTLTIIDGTVTGATGIYTKSGTVNIVGGKVKSTGTKFDYQYVSGGLAVTGDALVIDNCGYPFGAPTVSITGGDFISDKAYAVASYAGNGITDPIKGFISGGWFSSNYNNEWISNNLIADGYIAIADNSHDGCTHKIGLPPIAKIVTSDNTVYYSSLASAVADVPKDGTQTTIVMLADENIPGNTGVTISKGMNVTLDLNGKTISSTSPYAATSQLILNYGTLTIMDSTDENADGENCGKLSLVADAPSQEKIPGYASNVITNRGGTLTILSGLLENLSTTGYSCYAVDNNSNSVTTDAKLYIKGGKLSVANRTAVRQYACSSIYDNYIEMTGGTIISPYCAIQSQYQDGAPSYAAKVTLVIKDGTVTGNDYAWYDYNAYTTPNNSFDNATYSIQGGKFSKELWTYSDMKFISGGYFKEDVSSLVAPGYECLDTPDSNPNHDNYPYMIRSKVVTDGDIEVKIDSDTKQNEATVSENISEDNEKVIANNIIGKINGSGTGENKSKVVDLSKTVGNYLDTLNMEKVTSIAEEKGKKEALNTLLSKADTAVGESKNVEITMNIETDVDVTVTGITVEQEQSANITRIALDIKPYYTLTVVSEIKDGEKLESSETLKIVTEEMKEELDVPETTIVTFPAPDGFTLGNDDKLFVIHTKSNGIKYKYSADYDEDTKMISFENPDGFSEFALYKVSNGAKVVAQNVRTQELFSSLADAIYDENLVPNDTIIMIDDSAASDAEATIIIDDSITLDLNGKDVSVDSMIVFGTIKDSVTELENKGVLSVNKRFFYPKNLVEEPNGTFGKQVPVTVYEKQYSFYDVRVGYSRVSKLTGQYTVGSITKKQAVFGSFVTDKAVLGVNDQNDQYVNTKDVYLGVNVSVATDGLNVKDDDKTTIVTPIGNSINMDIIYSNELLYEYINDNNPNVTPGVSWTGISNFNSMTIRGFVESKNTSYRYDGKSLDVDFSATVSPIVKGDN